VHELETGHEAMVTAPDQLAALLIGVADRLSLSSQKARI
jgi:hypothetical protein